MKWTIVGFYPKLQLPYGAYIGADTAEEAVESVLSNARKNWPPEQQVVITAAVYVGGVIHEFGGLLSSQKGETVETALLPESAVSLRLKKKAERQLDEMRKTPLEPI